MSENKALFALNLGELTETKGRLSAYQVVGKCADDDSLELCKGKATQF